MLPGIRGMHFSIIIPVYNVEAYLRDCLESVLRQSYSDWEAICVNDGSTDGSDAVLQEFAAKDCRFQVISQVNGGLSSARNSGLKVAKGDYILFLDSDDWLEGNALEMLASNTEDEDLVCFSGRRFLEAGRVFRSPDCLTERVYQTGMDYYNDNALLRRDFAFVCVVLRIYKRSFLEENNLRFKEGIYHEDNLFTPLACYYAHRVRVINECLYDYRVRDFSITATYNPKRMKDLLDTANELTSFFILKKGFDKTVIYRAITHHYQFVLMNSPKDEKRELNQLCDWRLYRKVSRTKLRHIVNYWKNRLSML